MEDNPKTASLWPIEIIIPVIIVIQVGKLESHPVTWKYKVLVSNLRIRNTNNTPKHYEFYSCDYFAQSYLCCHV